MDLQTEKCDHKMHHIDICSVDPLQSSCYRFNVDCEASTGLYGLAEGAFGTAGTD